MIDKMSVAEFQEMFMPLRSHLYAVAYGILGSSDDALDAVQDLYVKLWQMRDKVDFHAVNVKAYSAVMIRNACYDRFRRSRLSYDSVPSEAHNQLMSDEDVGRATEAKDMALIVKRLLTALPDRQREVMELRAIEGLELKEIAECLGMTEVNVRVLLSRARRSLRDQIENIISYERKSK